jgi:hypothetical protein
LAAVSKDVLQSLRQCEHICQRLPTKPTSPLFRSVLSARRQRHKQHNRNNNARFVPGGSTLAGYRGH